MLRPVTTQPWPRNSAVRPSPTRRARSRPISMLDTSMLVSPNLSPESQIGTSWPMQPQVGSSGRIVVPVTPKGHTRGRWIVHHRLHVGPKLIGRAVDETFQTGLAPAPLDRIAVERELHEVFALDA